MKDDVTRGQTVWVAPLQTFPTSHMKVWLTEEAAIEAVREHLTMTGVGHCEYDPHDWILRTRIGE